MSHHDSHARAAAHIRHANRAGGFGDGLGFSFPGVGDPFKTTTTPAPPPTVSTTPILPTSSTTSANPAVSPVVPSSATSVSSSSASSSSPLTPSVPSSTTTTTTSLPITTTYSGSALHNNLTKFVTTFATTTAGPQAAAVASSSPSTVPTTSNALVAPVLGGVAGGVFGLAVIVFLFTYCLRRRKKDDEAINFDPGVFRRSAMLLNDPPTHQDTIARGFNPSPSMVENRQLYATQPNYDLSPGASPTSGNPLVFEAPFSPISPLVTSPVAAYANPSPVLTRNPSASSSTHAAPQYAQYPALPASRNNGGLMPQNESQYMDMERTSVTPFQAAQYAEISQRLNTEVPKGLDTPAVDEFVINNMKDKDADLPALPADDQNEDLQDPFAEAVEAEDDDDDEAEADAATLAKVQDLSFPAPPSPVATSSSRYRIDSTPPTLPEIVVQPRVSVASAYLSEAGASPAGSPFASGFPSGVGQTVLLKTSPFAESPIGSRFPVTPSPLASSFTVPTPPAAQTTFPADTPAAPEPVAQPRPDMTQRRSVYTVYDPEDAYGGI